MTNEQAQQARAMWESAPYPESDAAKLALAKRIIAAAGDLPESVFYEMCRTRPEIAPQLADLRPAGAAKYSGGRI